MVETLEELQSRLVELEAEEQGPGEPTRNTAPGRIYTFGGEQFEYIPTKYIQPKNDPADDPKNLVIGTKDKHNWYNRALPEPTWPNPGQEATSEVRAEYQEQMELCASAGRALTDYLHSRHAQNNGADIQAREMGGQGQRMDRDWAWLRGLWDARGMAVPSDADIDRMLAKKFGAFHKGK